MSDHTHPHPFQPDFEDAPFTRHQVMAESVIELLIERQVFSAEDMRRTLERIDAVTPAQGSRLVARAWLDEAFKGRLMADVNRAAAELDIDAGPIPLRAVENTAEVHNVIVCTLCSCYPRLLLGLPPDWYKSRAYRSRLVREPRTVLRVVRHGAARRRRGARPRQHRRAPLHGPFPGARRAAKTWTRTASPIWSRATP